MPIRTLVEKEKKGFVDLLASVLRPHRVPMEEGQGVLPFIRR
jgi:hypothetical protein